MSLCSNTITLKIIMLKILIILSIYNISALWPAKSNWFGTPSEDTRQPHFACGVLLGDTSIVTSGNLV